MPDTGSNEHVLDHLIAVRQSIDEGIATIVEWQNSNAKYTEAAKTVALNSIKTVPNDRSHVTDCTICITWDGSASG